MAMATDNDPQLAQLVGELASDPAYASGQRNFSRRVSLDEAARIAAMLQDEVDNGVDARQQLIDRENWQLACKPGCNSCCEEPIMVYRPEAARVARWLDRPENAEARAAFRAAYPAWRERQGSTPGRLSTIFASNPDGYVQAHKDAFARRILCAFNVEGKCTIYPVRPIVCRIAHALDTNENCHGGATEAVHRATFVPLDQFVTRTRALLSAAHHAARGPKRRVEALCTVVYELLPATPRPA
jgi:Fe-S-cluster containining protein